MAQTAARGLHAADLVQAAFRQSVQGDVRAVGPLRNRVDVSVGPAAAERGGAAVAPVSYTHLLADKLPESSFRRADVLNTCLLYTSRCV